MTTPPIEPERNDAPLTTAVPAIAGDADVGRTFKVGDSASITRTISQADIAAFAAVSGDDQPLHLDEAFAAQSKFGGIVAHGMLTGAIFSALLGKHLPGEGTILVGMSLTFTNPVRPGDVVTFSCRITSIAERGRMEISLTAHTASGQMVSAANAIVINRRGTQPSKA